MALGNVIHSRAPSKEGIITLLTALWINNKSIIDGDEAAQA